MIRETFRELRVRVLTNISEAGTQRGECTATAKPPSVARPPSASSCCSEFCVPRQPHAAARVTDWGWAREACWFRFDQRDLACGDPSLRIPGGKWDRGLGPCGKRN